MGQFETTIRDCGCEIAGPSDEHYLIPKRRWNDGIETGIGMPRM